MSEGDRRVELAPAAQLQLRRLPPGDAARLRGPILSLAIDAHPSGAAKLAGTDFWRLRIGDLRIIYRVDDDTEVVLILRVARRAESAYRRSLGGALRNKVGRVPDDETWATLRDAAQSTPDPDRAA